MSSGRVAWHVNGDLNVLMDGIDECLIRRLPVPADMPRPSNAIKWLGISDDGAWWADDSERGLRRAMRFLIQAGTEIIGLDEEPQAPVEPPIDNVWFGVVDNPAKSAAIQRRLFELGIYWRSGERDVLHKQNARFLCVFRDPGDDYPCLRWGSSEVGLRGLPTLQRSSLDELYSLGVQERAA